MDDRRKKGEFVGALGALLVHVAVIALLILVSFTVPQPDEDAGGVPVMLGNVESARGFDDPSLVDVDILPEEPEAPAPAETQPELPSEQDLLTQTEEEKGCQCFRKGSADGRQQRYFRQRHGNRRQQGRQFIHRSEDRNRRLRNI